LEQELRESATEILAFDPEGIILDLRDNGGGFIAPALKMADEFLKDDVLIMFTKNKKGAIENNFATNKGSFEQGKVYVLINENSASASEIFAGAIQDNDRGTIVGRRSYGKGLVQREMALGDGSAIRLTISRYYTPTGRSIQKPYTNGNKEYFNEYMERYKNGELQNADSIQVADSLKFKTPGGKIVYGGGGIIPDIFVSKDTTRVGETLDYMLRSGRMGGYVFEELDKNRAFYNDLSENEFNEEINIDDTFAEDFLTYSRKRGVEIELKNYKDQLKKYLKATMAQQLFGTGAFERIINKDDAMINKVLSLSKE
jgi:carboxyl-terminal processing protease